VVLNHNYRLPVDALINVLSSKRVHTSTGLNLIVNAINPIHISCLTPTNTNLLPMVLSFENVHKGSQSVRIKTPYSYEIAPAGLIPAPVNSRYDI
jgi:hypothetical protein